MFSIVKKLWARRRDFYYLPYSLYFNFHYLPFAQAIKLPILLYKPHFIKLKGSVSLEFDGKPIKTGQIRMGFPLASVYPNNGIVWDNNGGHVIFRGSCLIGNDTYVSLGEKTTVDFGDDFLNTAGLKMVSYRGIKIGQKARFGWGVLIMDTNFHPLYDIKNKKFKQASGNIEIGDYNWFGTQCKIMHSVKTLERCIFGMGSTITRGSEMRSYCVMGGNPIKILSENVMRDYDNDREFV